MATIVHLSDLHLLASPREQEIIFDGLVDALEHVHDHASEPIGNVALLNRYFSEVAQLTLSGLGDAAVDAFGSATDLGTGLERPLPLERGAEPGTVHVRAPHCAPRTLLRIYWRLDRA